MTVLAACGLKESGVACLELAAMLARSSGEDVVVAVVVAAAWPPSTERVDAEYRDLLTRRGEHAIERARTWLPTDVEAQFVLHHSSSITSGLLELVEHHGASAIVLGSAESGGLGHVALGSVADRIVHSSPVPVAFAPRGFQPASGARVGRVTAAFGGTPKDRQVVIEAAKYAARTSAAFRIASFSVRPRMIFASTAARPGEDLVLDQWFGRTEKVIGEQLDEVRTLPDVPSPLEVMIGEGYGWREAIDQHAWASTDVLVVGSGSHGPLASVFLGSRASKILRNTPAPVIALPRTGF